MPSAAILSQGDEVVTGQIADTNAAWLADRLTALGFDVVRHQCAGDRLTDVVGLFTEVAGKVDLALSTGGLGPTEDDLTAEAAAVALGCALRLDEASLHAIEAMYARFGRPMPAVNRKQAMFPEVAFVVENHWGTAPGFGFDLGGTRFVCMPGVPREMKQMFPALVEPMLRERYALRPGDLVTLRTTGLGESAIQERIGSFAEPDVVLGYRANSPDVLVKLRFAADVDAERREAVVARVAGAVGPSVYAIERPGEPARGLAAVVGELLAARGATLAIAESCTGGRLAGEITGVAGSSAYFLEGVITYANAAKVRLLGVSEADLAAHGAVSEVVARAMAEGCRARAGATFALATTGIAGPGGGSAEKPVGTVHIALSTPTMTLHRQVRLPGERERVQVLAAAAALDLLRRHLMESP